MNEAEWLASDDPGAMLQLVNVDRPASMPLSFRKVSDRKLRLFACACCRLVWDLLTDERSRQAVEVAERYADGEAKEGRREQARLAASAARVLVTPPRGPAAAYAAAIAAHQALCDPSLLSDVARMFCDDLPSALGALRPAQAALLRDLCGNPWRPVLNTDERGWVKDRASLALALAFCTPTVRALARAAYEERRQVPCATCGGRRLVEGEGRGHYGATGTLRRCPDCRGTGHTCDGLLDPDRLAVLADALEDAGADSADLLTHLRSPGPHARGCWALDLVLGKE